MLRTSPATIETPRQSDNDTSAGHRCPRATDPRTRDRTGAYEYQRSARARLRRRRATPPAKDAPNPSRDPPGSDGPRRERKDRDRGPDPIPARRIDRLPAISQPPPVQLTRQRTIAAIAHI